jgi:hypothetical protein
VKSDQPFRRNGHRSGWISEPFVPTAIFVDARRWNAISKVAANIDLRGDAPSAALHRFGKFKPKVATAAAGDDVSRRRQFAMFGFKATKMIFATRINIEYPDAWHRSGRDADVAIGHAPEATDRLRISRGVVKAAFGCRLFRARIKWKHRQACSSVN